MPRSEAVAPGAPHNRMMRGGDTNRAFAVTTIGDLVRSTGQPIHRVRYAIQALGIESNDRAGNTRIFWPDQVAAIEAEVKRLAANDDRAA